MGLFGPSAFEKARDAKLAQRQKALDEAEEELANIPPHPEEEIIAKTPAWQLAENIRDKSYTSLDVVAAFARRCLFAQKETNCLTEGQSPPHL